VKIRLLFFGRLGDFAGRSESEVDLPRDVATVAGLASWLASGNEALGAELRRKTTRVMVNSMILQGDHKLADGDEVAFLPPVSGG
jgi:molybdopterin converting factor subunit 1